MDKSVKFTKKQHVSKKRTSIQTHFDEDDSARYAKRKINPLFTYRNNIFAVYEDEDGDDGNNSDTSTASGVTVAPSSKRARKPSAQLKPSLPSTDANALLPLDTAFCKENIPPSRASAEEDDSTTQENTQDDTDSTLDQLCPKPPPKPTVKDVHMREGRVRFEIGLDGAWTRNGLTSACPATGRAAHRWDGLRWHGGCCVRQDG